MSLDERYDPIALAPSVTGTFLNHCRGPDAAGPAALCLRLAVTVPRTVTQTLTNSARIAAAAGMASGRRAPAGPHPARQGRVTAWLPFLS